MLKPKISVDNSPTKKGKIGRAAAKVFNKKDYIATDIDDIAAAANTSKGGIYHYFASKNEILHFILDTYVDIVLKDLEIQLQDLQDNASKIKFIMERHIDLYTNYVDQAKTLLHDAHCLSPKRFNAISVKQREYYRIVMDVLSEFFGVTAEMKREALKAVAFLLFGMCTWHITGMTLKVPSNPRSFLRSLGGFSSRG